VATIVYLVRHAHARWEASEERPLSDQGRAAAADLAGWFGSTPIAAIYSSPARRAIETIQPLADARGILPRIVPDLRERELVVGLGTTFEAAVEAAWRSPATGSGGTESNRAAAARGIRALQEIVSAHRDQCVVVSTHGNLLALMLNSLDSSYGYETWRALTFPDVYRLDFLEGAPTHVERVWGQRPNGGLRALSSRTE